MSSAISQPADAGDHVADMTHAGSALHEPLRISAFRALWLSQLIANVGAWMQTVGAQWFLASSTTSATLVALVQTATSLPFFLFGMPAGVLADIVDRRRLLVTVNCAMAATAGLLALGAVTERLSAVGLLLATFALGLGQTIVAPSWLAVVPELVPRRMVPTATMLGSAGYNGARVVGPTMGGLFVAAAGPATVFAMNAVSFLVLAAAVLRWGPTNARPTATERLGAALWAGLGYVRFSRLMRRLLLRCMLWTVPAAAIWALLPVVAHGRLSLSSSGYGLLLGALSTGSVVGAFVLAPIRHRLSPNMLIAAASAVFGAVLVVVALVTVPVLTMLVLFVAGVAWMVVMSTFMATAQFALPEWVRARGLATYLLVFNGGQAVGAVLWGAVADLRDAALALVLAGVTLIVSAVSIVRWGLLPMKGFDPSHASHWIEPHLALNLSERQGPVMVLVEYRVPPANVSAFLDALPPLGRSRRRTGARRWEVFQDVEDPVRFVESYLVGSWAEHMHQHAIRQTRSDQQIQATVRALAVGRPSVQHLVTADRRTATGA